MENLKDFMLLFRMELNPNYQPTQEELMGMKKSWGEWIGGIAQKARLVSSHQLGFEGTIIAPNTAPATGFITTEKQAVSGNLVLKATNINEAVEFAQNCPILMAGGTVEIRNTLNVF